MADYEKFSTIFTFHSFFIPKQTFLMVGRRTVDRQSHIMRYVAS